MIPLLPCPACGCRDPHGRTVHTLVAALRVDDVDRAIEVGLLDCDGCPGCSATCTEALLAARAARVAALAARERHRARNARLQRRAVELATRRNAPVLSAHTPTALTTQPALPTAAAAALARAKAKAAERHRS